MVNLGRISAPRFRIPRVQISELHLHVKISQLHHLVPSPRHTHTHTPPNTRATHHGTGGEGRVETNYGARARVRFPGNGKILYFISVTKSEKNTASPSTIKKDLLVLQFKCHMVGQCMCKDSGTLTHNISRLVCR